MSSIVVELQREALDSHVRISDLLRKALVVARKLGIQEFQTWADHELSGYREEEKVPEYRMLEGRVKAWNPFRGWIPLMYDDPQMERTLSRRACGQAIAELESLVQRGGKTSNLMMPCPSHINRALSKGASFDTEFGLMLQQQSIVGVLDAVRNIVLNWALKLEEDGILGEGLSFTEQEKEKAAMTTSNVNNFYGPIGHSQIQQSADNPTQLMINSELDTEKARDFVKSLKDSLDQLGLNSEQEAELRAEIQTIESQVDSPKPKKFILREALASAGRLLENTTANVAATLIAKLSGLTP
jgi:AbiTii-like protein